MCVCVCRRLKSSRRCRLKIRGFYRCVKGRAFVRSIALTIDQHTRTNALALPDPISLQACTELSYKTPAQVLQEYQNRNRGISINYNTHTITHDGTRPVFKTIVSVGNVTAEVGGTRSLCLFGSHKAKRRVARVFD